MDVKIEEKPKREAMPFRKRPAAYQASAQVRVDGDYQALRSMLATKAGYIPNTLADLVLEYNRRTGLSDEALHEMRTAGVDAFAFLELPFDTCALGTVHEIGGLAFVVWELMDRGHRTHQEGRTKIRALLDRKAGPLTILEPTKEN